jgi:hypothetical protein
VNKYRQTEKIFNPVDDLPPSFQRYQFDPKFGSTANNHLIRLSPEMMQAMTKDMSLREQMQVLLAPARKHLVD